MYLLDTNIVSELRKKSKTNQGVRTFMEQSERESVQLYLSVITVGELQRGVELIQHHGDLKQAKQLGYG